MKKLLDKPELIFVILAFIFGLLFSLLTPPLKVADEDAHILRSCEVADGIFYNKTPAQDVACDKYFEDIIKRPQTMHQATGYSPLLYAIPAIGIKISSVTNNGLFMFYFARFLNMLAWIILTAFAIRITPPVFKWLFLFTALLPMTVFEGMSLASDSFNTGFAFLFFAYIFKLIYDTKELKKSDYIKLSLMSIISAFTKGTIYPILLFVFLPIKKHKYLFACFCLITAMILTGYWKSINLTFIRPDLDPEFHRNMLLTNPIDFIVISLKTMFYKTWFYTRNCIGILGWLDVRFKGIVYILTTIVFISACNCPSPEKPIPKSHRILALSVWIIFTLSLFVMYYIIWTLPSDTNISGIQGRYYTPMLPYLFIIFANNKIVFSQKFQDNFKVFLIIFSTALLTYSCFVLNNHYHVL